MLLLFFSGCVSPFVPPLVQTPPPASSPTVETRGKATVFHSSDLPRVRPGVFYTTIAEVLKHPTLFDGQQVRFTGRVVGVRDSTFDLTDGTSNTVKVVTTGPAAIREGLEVTVTGRLTMPRSAASSPSLLEIQDAHVVPIATSGKTRVQPATTLQSERLPSSPPIMLPVPPLPPEDEGRVF